MFEILFWICFIALIHTYIIYPLVLKIFPKSLPSDRNETGSGMPVSILIPAHNEEKIIRQKLESILASDYPKEKIEIIVGSDASTDKTNEIVKSFPGVRLINFEERSGKPKIINKLVTLAQNEVLILTDANVLFDRNTIRELTKHFSVPQIALVDSNMIHSNFYGDGIAKAEGVYIRGETIIKHNEGIVFGMMMGPFGGCYAVRKSFYSPVPENFLVDDFYVNMKVLEKGGKAISEINAKVFEEVPNDWKIEFKRKIRIATGSFQNLKAFSHLLFRFDILSFCFFSHKVLRWFSPFFIIGLYVTNLFLVLKLTGICSEQESISFSENFFYAEGIYFYFMFFMLQNFIVLLFLLDVVCKIMGVHFLLTRVITHFFSTNLALLIGFFRFLMGVRTSIWTPTKR